MTQPNSDEVLDAVESSEPEVSEAQILDDEVQANETEAEGGEPANADGEGQAPEADLAAQVAEWKDKYLRLHAEWDTYRRRMKEQQAEERARATEKLVSALIPVLDDFERTLDYADKNGEKGLLGGVQAVHNKLDDVLVREGVVIIDPAGQPYDALEAQAVGTVEDASVPDETVAQVFQKGYRMGSKVIRPAMVTIAVGGPKRQPEEGQASPDETSNN